MSGFVWDFDPTFFTLGPLTVRYYGLIFVLMLLAGFFIFRWQARRAGYTQDQSEDYLIWGVLSVVIGARLGHCFFYEPGYYLSRPLEILMVWKGGLASHGATVGIILGLYLYGRKYRMPYLDIMDRFSMAAAIGAGAVRLGNFLNSEIVGRVTDVPWAVRFVRFEDQGMYPRHPSQIYEFLMAGVVLLILYLIDRKLKENRPRGLMMALFLLLYFSGRFIVEFFKEYQTLNPESSPLTMGQYLSIPFVLFSLYMIYRIIRNRNTFVMANEEEYKRSYFQTEKGKAELKRDKTRAAQIPISKSSKGKKSKKRD